MADVGCVSPTTIAVGWLPERTESAVPPWGRSPANVLKAHWGAIAGADFLTTEVWTWLCLVTYYTVFVIDLASRRLQILGSTPHPEAQLMEQIVRTLTMARDGVVDTPPC